MSRRPNSHPVATRSFAVRAACVLTGVAALLVAGGSVTYAQESGEPADTEPAALDTPTTEAPETTVPEFGEVDGTVVAVGLPPVPATFVPDAEPVVAVGLPPVPSFTVPDAAPPAASQAPTQELPETGDASHATAAVARAAAGVGAALTSISRGV